MSIFVRRTQHKIAKLESQLAAARTRLAYEIELDVERDARKARKAAAKAAAAAERRAARAAAKAARAATRGDPVAERRAARQADPRRVRLETFYVLMTLCLKDNHACTMDTVDAYMEWKKTVEFPPNTNLYQKCIRFRNETMRDETIAVPIYAKTMTGELIPLVYHPHHDSRELLIQLHQISPEEFPIGSTMIRRLCDDPSVPVQEGDVFGLFRHNATLVYYEPHRHEVAELERTFDRVIVEYDLKIRSAGFNCDPDHEVRSQDLLTLRYAPERQTISTSRNGIHRSLRDIRDALREWQAFDYMVGDYYTLNEQAQEEIVAVFEAIRRDL